MSDLPPIYTELRDYAGRIITFRELGQKLQRKLGARAQDRVMAELVAGAMEIRNDIVVGMRNSPEGKAYFRGFRYRKNKKGESVRKAVFHRASRPGFPPRPDSGRLINSILMDVRFAEVEVGSTVTNPAYPKWLEHGTDRMAARPWLWPAVTGQMPRIKAAVTRVLRQVAAEMAE